MAATAVAALLQRCDWVCVLHCCHCCSTFVLTWHAHCFSIRVCCHPCVHSCFSPKLQVCQYTSSLCSVGQQPWFVPVSAPPHAACVSRGARLLGFLISVYLRTWTKPPQATCCGAGLQLQARERKEHLQAQCLATLWVVIQASPYTCTALSQGLCLRRAPKAQRSSFKDEPAEPQIAQQGELNRGSIFQLSDSPHPSSTRPPTKRTERMTPSSRHTTSRPGPDITSCCQPAVRPVCAARTAPGCGSTAGASPTPPQGRPASAPSEGPHHPPAGQPCCAAAHPPQQTAQQPGPTHQPHSAAGAAVSWA